MRSPNESALVSQRKGESDDDELESNERSEDGRCPTRSNVQEPLDLESTNEACVHKVEPEERLKEGATNTH